MVWGGGARLIHFILTQRWRLKNEVIPDQSAFVLYRRCNGCHVCCTSLLDLILSYAPFSLPPIVSSSSPTGDFAVFSRFLSFPALLSLNIWICHLARVLFFPSSLSIFSAPGKWSGRVCVSIFRADGYKLHVEICKTNYVDSGNGHTWHDFRLTWTFLIKYTTNCMHIDGK